jgi:hypothetical protein
MLMARVARAEEHARLFLAFERHGYHPLTTVARGES